MIPKFNEIMKPMLELLKDGNIYHQRDIIEKLAEHFKLTPEERNELLPSGQQSVFDNRVGWAKTYLLKALLIDSPKRGYIQITERGEKVLEENPESIDVNFLKRFNEFKEWLISSSGKKHKDLEIEKESGSPEELIYENLEKINSLLKKDLLDRLLTLSFNSFEKLVIDVIVKMGYGGSFEEAKEHLGKSGDEGIDGLIKQDILGLDKIYIQAKKWKEGSVGRQEIQKFVGALHGKGATKGIFITTSKFTSDAIDYASKLNDITVTLIDGEKLVDYMLKFNVGVQVKTTIEIKKIDEDYFEEL